MLCSGLAIGAGFLLFLAFGRPDAAVLCAFFTNFLCLSDKATHVVTRVWVQVLGALVFAGLGGLGLLIAGHTALILITVFAVALAAGFVHGTVPGVEALPRYGLCCLVVASFVTIDRADALAAILLGTPIAVATVLLDDYARHGRRGSHMAIVRANISYPGPRFRFVYACAALCGMAVGLLWSDIRPYWVTVTTLLVMQPDRRANTVRVVQRFVGTLAGVVAAFAVVRGPPDSWRSSDIFVFVLALPFLWPLGYDRNYALGVAILCMWVLLLIDSALPPGELATPLFLTRLSDTAIGCAIALAGSLAVFETGERQEASPGARSV